METTVKVSPLWKFRARHVTAVKKRCSSFHSLGDEGQNYLKEVLDLCTKYGARFPVCLIRDNGREWLQGFIHIPNYPTLSCYALDSIHFLQETISHDLNPTESL